MKERVSFLPDKMKRICSLCGKEGETIGGMQPKHYICDECVTIKTDVRLDYQNEEGK